MTTATGAASGLLSFIRYAFMPNHLGYCGGNDNDTLLEHGATGKTDPRLAPLLVKFTGAFPYLRTIASANNISDPFDERVVEAYWVGNELLEHVEAGALFRSLDERFGKQLKGTLREQVLRKAPQGAKPYHLFHVIDVYRHLEHASVGMAAMESCRISWGKVIKDDGATVTVEREPLVLEGGKLALGAPQLERATKSVSGMGFIDEVAPGDWVAMHWGWVCEVLDQRKLANLRRYNDHHLRIANQTI